MLGFGARDQHARLDMKLAPPELLDTRDVLGWLALQPLVQIASVMEPFELSQLVLGMREKVDALAPQRMAEQDLGGQFRHAYLALAEKLKPLLERDSELHRATPRTAPATSAN
jgi:hypothetical protein